MRPTHYLAVLLTKPEARCGSLCASDNFRRISEKPEELRYHLTVVIPSYFMFFYDFGKFDCTQHVGWGVLLHTISMISYNFMIRNGKHISHLQKILKRDEEWRISKKVEQLMG